MGFGNAIKSGFRGYVKFSGRASRSELWFWLLFSILFQIVGALLDLASGLGGVGDGPLRALMALVLFLPSLSLSVRRLHDIDRSGWWLFIVAIPLIGSLILLFWHIQPGTRGANRFGADPLDEPPADAAEAIA